MPAPLPHVKAVFRPPKPAGPRASVGRWRRPGPPKRSWALTPGKQAVFARSKLFVTSPSDASGANGASASRVARSPIRMPRAPPASIRTADPSPGTAWTPMTVQDDGVGWGRSFVGSFAWALEIPHVHTWTCPHIHTSTRSIATQAIRLSRCFSNRRLMASSPKVWVELSKFRDSIRSCFHASGFK
jgi:hypothetical protein